MKSSDTWLRTFLSALLLLTLSQGCGQAGDMPEGRRAPFGGPVPFPTYADPGYYVPRPTRTATPAGTPVVQATATSTPTSTLTPAPTDCDDDSHHRR